ncbi:MAG: hypothetical protein HND52_12395 [Ignavibacteriae bacterium]|nr:hypothetical protein [Ignavibacteriota bacterium]
MMIKIKNFAAAIITMMFILFLFNCGGSEETVKKEEVKTVIDEEIIVPDLKVNIHEMYCWVDLMPGGPNRFQISGNLNVSDSYKYDLKFLKLKAVRIFQNNKQLFSIRPKVKLDENAITEEGKSFVFSTIRGLSINPEYKIDNPVDIRIIFEEDDELFEYNIYNQKVEKVY